MPTESTTVQEVQTQTAKDLQKTTESAMKSVSAGGLNDPEFLKGLQDAIDKDSGKTVTPPPAKLPVETKAADPAQPPAKPAAQTSKAVVDDIPPELLGEPKPSAKVTTETAAAVTTDADAERQRQIDEQTKGMTTKAAERFKRIEARAYEADKRAKAAEAELMAERAKKAAPAPAAPPVDNAELERLRKQNEEFDAIIAKHAIQEHPGFKAKYDAAIAKEIAAMAKLIPQEHAEEFSQLASLPESKKRNERIEEITEGIQDNIQKTKIRIGLANTDRLSSERAEQLANWKEGKVHAEAEQIRQQEREQARQQEIQKVAWSKGMAKMTSPESGLEVFRKSEGSDEWNTGVDNRISSVERLISGMSSMQPEQIVELAARSVALDDYRRMFMAQRILVQKLTSELEDLKSASPDASGNQGGEAAVPDKMSYIDAITKATVSAGALK